MAEEKKLNVHEIDEDDEEESEVEQNWDDWNADDEEDSDSDLLLCLFCESKFSSAESLFQHCSSTHSFDFHKFRRAFGLDFYDSFKLINYIRSQVSNTTLQFLICVHGMLIFLNCEFNLMHIYNEITVLKGIVNLFELRKSERETGWTWFVLIISYPFSPRWQ